MVFLLTLGYIGGWAFERAKIGRLVYVCPLSMFYGAALTSHVVFPLAFTTLLGAWVLYGFLLMRADHAKPGPLMARRNPFPCPGGTYNCKTPSCPVVSRVSLRREPDEHH